MDNRTERLMPNGIPRWIRCYDNGGKTFDRYTVVFTGNYAGRNRLTHARCMSSCPFHPQGFGMWEEYRNPIDWPQYSHLGRRVKFQDLPEDCQRLVLEDYRDLWRL